MPRYFFQIDDGTLLPDELGTELRGLDEARSAAVSFAGEMLKELDGHFWSGGRKWTLHVTDERNKLLFSLHFNSEIPAGEVTYLAEASDDVARPL